MAIIAVKDFSFSYRATSDESVVPVVENVSFSVEPGAFCVVVGSTGSGKTTLLRSLKPELMPVGLRSGSVEVCGTPLIQDGQLTQAMSATDSATGIGYVMQDPAAQIVCDTVWHELAFGLENVGTPTPVMRRRVAEVAHFFGIEPWIHNDTETLSGGQQQLVNLAGILALRPQVLLLDEPTAQLDPHAVKQFLFMLARVNTELGVTIVMATHAPEDVEAYATQYVTLSEIGSYVPRSQAEHKVQSWRQAQACAHAKAPVCIQMHDAYFRYEKAAPWVMRGLDIQVMQGSVHAVVGGNGCGKTTLLKLMAGIVKPQRGVMRNALAQSQALLPQDPKALFVCDTVMEELHEWRERVGYTDQDVRDILIRFGLDSHVYQHPYDLSGGQQQKLALAKLLLCQPQVLFLDEPTKGLDPASCAEVSHIIRQLATQGTTLVLVTHDLDFALVTADTVSMIFDGEVACTEPSSEFFAHNLVYRPNEKSRLYGVI